MSVLIRGDADVSEIEGTQVPGRLSRLDKDKPTAYLIDVMDTFSPWAERRATERVALYKAKGWERTTFEEMMDDLRNRPKRDDK